METGVRTIHAPPLVADATPTLLTRLAVALNRRRAYRSSHPMVVRAELLLLESITTVMSSRTELTLGVGPRELLLDGKRLRSRLSVTREVAARLHRRGVSSLTFLPGITGDGVRALIGWLTADSGTAADPSTGAPEVPGFQIARIAYDRLVLRDSPEASEEQVTSIWEALSAVALSPIGSGSPESAVAVLPSAIRESNTVSAGEILAAIRDGADDPAYAKRLSATFFTLVDQATHATPRQRADIGQRLCAVLPLLDDRSLLAILSQVGSAEQQQAFVAQVAEALPLDAVVGWLEVAARANRQNLSHHLLRLMRKLSTTAQGHGGGAATDASFRDAAQDLVSGWDIDDPNPTEHIELLDQIALIESERSSTPDMVSQVSYLAETNEEAIRLIQMSLELDEVSEDARVAVRQLTMAGRSAELLDLIDRARAGVAAAELRAVAASPDALRAVLLGGAPEVGTARALVAAAGPEAIPALFDILATSDLRIVRRIVYDRLREFGRVIWPEFAPRLEHATWFFARNLLDLMRDLRTAALEQGGDMQPLPMTGVARYLSHERDLIRLKAVRLLLDEPSMRDGVLRRAFNDTSVRVLRDAIESVITIVSGNREPVNRAAVVPAELRSRLLLIIDDKERPVEMRARAVWALGAFPDRATRDWLLGHTTQVRPITRRVVLAESRPTVLAALGLLAREFGDDPRAQKVLSMARATSDLRSQAVSGSHFPAGAHE